MTELTPMDTQGLQMPFKYLQKIHLTSSLNLQVIWFCMSHSFIKIFLYMIVENETDTSSDDDISVVAGNTGNEVLFAAKLVIIMR